MNSIKLLVILLLVIVHPVFSQTDSISMVPVDSSMVEVRQVDQAKLDELRNRAELDYGTGPAAMSLWERFKAWLSKLFRSLVGIAITTDWVTVLMVVLVIIALIYVILRLLRIDALKVLYTGSGTNIRYDTIDENIHEMDFDKLLDAAIQKNDYRLAIRLLFLQALKILSDKHIIHWQPGKTNHDYLQEVTTAEVKTGFEELNYYFEYAWYGNFKIAPELFGKVKTVFNTWKANI